MTRVSAIERAERCLDAGKFRDDLACRVAFRTESQVPESRPQFGIYFEREIAPTFQHMGYATEIVPHSYSWSQHAPNEHVLAPLMREGLRMMTECSEIWARRRP